MNKRPPKVGLTQKVVSAVWWNSIVLPLVQVVTMLSSIVVARALGVAQFGALSVLLAVVGTVNQLANLGIDRSIPKFERETRHNFGEERWNEFVSMLFSVRFAVVLMFSVGLLLFHPLIAPFLNVTEYTRWTALLLSLICVFQVIAGFYATILVSNLGAKFLNLGTLAGNFSQGLALIVGAVAGLGIDFLLFAYLLGALVRLVITLPASRDLFTMRRVDWSSLRKERQHTKRFAIYSMTTYFVVVTRYVFSPAFGILLINLFAGQHVVGLFSVGTRVAEMVSNLLNIPISYLTGPIFAATFVDKSHEKLRKAYRLLTQLLHLLFFGPLLGFCFVSGPLIRWMYGVSYEGAIPIAIVAAVFVLIRSVNTVGNSVLHTYERYRWLTFSILSGFIVMAVVLLLFKPLSAMGVIFAQGLGSAVFQIVAMVIAGYHFQARYPFRELAKVLVACLPMSLYFAFSDLIAYDPRGLLVYIVWSVVAFGGMYRLLGGLGREAREIVESVKFPGKELFLRCV